jgi:hypothetical protein
MTVAGLWRPSRPKNVTSQAVRTESALSGTEATNFPVAGSFQRSSILGNIILIEANRGTAEGLFIGQRSQDIHCKGQTPKNQFVDLPMLGFAHPASLLRVSHSHHVIALALEVLHRLLSVGPPGIDKSFAE